MRVFLLTLALLSATGLATAQIAPGALLRKEAGNVFLKQRQYAQARDQYLAALQVSPDYQDVHYNLGVIYFFRLQDYPRALYHFVRYAQLDPQASDLDQVRSLTLQALEKIEGAERQAYDRAVRQGTRGALQTFLALHPDSHYAADARERSRRLKQ